MPRSSKNQIGTSDLLPKPALVVGSWEGEVAVVRAETGVVTWRRRTGRELGTLAQDGRRFYIPLGAPFSLHKERLRAATAAKRERVDRRNADAEAQPGRLECRRIVDGALLWTTSDWSLKGPLDVDADSDMVLVAAHDPARRPDVKQIAALDPQTGAVRWSVLGSQAPVRPVRLIALSGDRAFIGSGTLPLPPRVLESQTGRELRRTVGPVSLLSRPNRMLVARVQPRHDQETEVTVLRAEDGSELYRMPAGERRMHILTDVGIVYVSSQEYLHPWVASVDVTRGGGEQWRADGIRADTLTLDSGRVYYACLHANPHMPHHGDKITEVGALDAETGAPLWSWRSPSDTAALLRLWGWRTPAMLAHSVKKSSVVFASRLANPEPHVSRLPYTLHSASSGLWLEARDGLVFVGTRLGLFALVGSSGHLRWHALPDVDLSFVEPALPPV